jgi:iron complex outermembrane recepter protein
MDRHSHPTSTTTARRAAERPSRLKPTAAAAAWLLGCAAGGAWAQTTPPSPTADAVIVLGNKLPKGEQSVTSSVEVLTERRLEQIGAVELKDVLQRVGNAGLTTVGSGRFDQFTLRGVPSSGVTPSATPVATLYLDGAPIPDEIYGSAVSNAWDVAQFELFRGAQSTLLGRNSLIGAIYVRTKDPDYATDARGRVAAGSFGANEISVAGGGALIRDRAAWRVAGQQLRSDGEVERRDGQRADPRESRMARAKLLLEPAPGTTVLGTVMHVVDSRGSALVDATRVEDRVQTTNVLGRVDRSFTVGSLRAETTLNKQWSVSAVFTRSGGEVSDTSDFDGLPAVGNPVVDPIRREQRKLDDSTQELLLSYRSGAGLVGVVGVYMGSAKSAQTPDVRTIQGVPTVPLDALRAIFGAPSDLTDVYTGFGFAAVPASAPRLTTDNRILGNGLELGFAGRFDNSNRSRALFTQWDWSFAKQWTAILGLRYERERARFALQQQNTLLQTSDAQTLAGTNTALIGGVAAAIAPSYASSACPALGLSLPVCAGAIVQRGYGPLVSGLLQQLAGANFLSNVDLRDERSYSVALPKLGITHEFSEQQSLSVVVQRAYRAGGLGVNPVRGTVFSFEPEYSTNTELAWRQRSADGRLTLNANLFHIDWKDQQLEVARSATAQDTETLNVGASTLTGAELGLRYVLTRGWSVFGSLALLNTKVEEDRRTAAQLGGQPSLVGSRFPFAPRQSGSIGVTHDTGRGLSGTFDLVHQGDSEALLPNSVKNGGRTIGNLRLGWRFSEAWSVQALVRNISDKTYLLNASAAGNNVIVGSPRSVSLSASGRF